MEGWRARAEVWTPATERVTLYCILCLSALTTGLHGPVATNDRQQQKCNHQHMWMTLQCCDKMTAHHTFVDLLHTRQYLYEQNISKVKKNNGTAVKCLCHCHKYMKAISCTGEVSNENYEC